MVARLTRLVRLLAALLLLGVLARATLAVSPTASELAMARNGPRAGCRCREFSCPESPQKSVTFRLRGLETEARYSLRNLDEALLENWPVAS